jgi:DNA-binding protein HU-beta
MAKKKAPAKRSVENENLPAVSKHTAGGIGGAVIGGMIAGPVGAIAGGVAGALIGKSSAEGNKPVKKAMASVRSKVAGAGTAKALTTERGAKTSLAGVKKTAKKKSLPSKRAASTGAKKKSKKKPAVKQAKSAPKAKGAKRAAKKKR